MAENKHRYLGIKYAFDKITAALGLLITSPLFLIVALGLKINKQDVFYLQKRAGYRGNDIFVYKFTTMPKGSEKFGYITTTNDSRPFKFGKFLRKTKINELPQLINVLLGSMSLVGPRPLVREQIATALSGDEIKEYYKMRPGITGAASLIYHHEDELLASISDPFEYDRTILLPHKKRLEMAYAEKWSLRLDLKIISLTIWAIINNKVHITEADIFNSNN
jgi:lipopolysaccharide/colanic/teichoic acid biosynthesis glycosyltransferase